MHILDPITPPVIAHRGANNLAPENTLAAFKKAKAVGATGWNSMSCWQTMAKC